MKLPQHKLAVVFAAMVAASPTVGAGNSFNFQPDAQTSFMNKEILVDIALLGDQGEITTGFVASLDPFHGRPFATGWRLFYDPWLGRNPRNTNTEAVQRVKNHLMAHGIPEDFIDTTYKKARGVWERNPELRSNSSDPSP